MSRTQSKYDWPYHIAQQKTSGLSVKEYCTQQGFSSWSFYVNRQKLSKPALAQKKAITQVPASFLNLGTFQHGTTTILISFPDGIKVEIKGEQSTEYLGPILNTLRIKGGSQC